MLESLSVVNSLAAVALVVIALQALLLVLDRFTHGDTGTQKSSQLHILRRVQHCCTGLLLLIIYPLLGHDQSKLFALVPTLIHGGVDYYRRRINPDFNRWFLKLTGNILRPEEQNDRFSASVWFLAGVTCVPFITRKHPAVYLSVLNLSFCDPAASLVGITVQSPRLYGSKSASGSLAACVTGAILAVAYTLVFQTEVSVLLATAIAGVAEFVTIPRVDDNFSIPVLSALLWEFALS